MSTRLHQSDLTPFHLNYGITSLIHSDACFSQTLHEKSIGPTVSLLVVQNIEILTDVPAEYF